MRRKKLGPAAAIGIVLASVFAFASNPPIITGAQLRRRGEAVELHFKITGRSRWRLSSHGSQLWIDLDRVHVQLPPRPLFGYETPPISSVRTINLDTGSRLLIEVNQKTDYAIASLPGELLVRLAPEGKILDLTALKNARPAPRVKADRAERAPRRAPDLSSTAVRPASIAPSERLALASPSMGDKAAGPVRD